MPVAPDAGSANGELPEVAGVGGWVAIQESTKPASKRGWISLYESMFVSPHMRLGMGLSGDEPESASIAIRKCRFRSSGV